MSAAPAAVHWRRSAPGLGRGAAGRGLRRSRRRVGAAFLRYGPATLLPLTIALLGARSLLGGARSAFGPGGPGLVQPVLPAPPPVRTYQAGSAVQIAFNDPTDRTDPGGWLDAIVESETVHGDLLVNFEKGDGLRYSCATSLWRVPDLVGSSASLEPLNATVVSAYGPFPCVVATWPGGGSVVGALETGATPKVGDTLLVRAVRVHEYSGLLTFANAAEAPLAAAAALDQTAPEEIAPVKARPVNNASKNILKLYREADWRRGLKVNAKVFKKTPKYWLLTLPEQGHVEGKRMSVRGILPRMSQECSDVADWLPRRSPPAAGSNATRRERIDVYVLRVRVDEAMPNTSQVVTTTNDIQAVEELDGECVPAEVLHVGTAIGRAWVKASLPGRRGESIIGSLPFREGARKDPVPGDTVSACIEGVHDETGSVNFSLLPPSGDLAPFNEVDIDQWLHGSISRITGRGVKVDVRHPDGQVYPGWISPANLQQSTAADPRVGLHVGQNISVRVVEVNVTEGAAKLSMELSTKPAGNITKFRKVSRDLWLLGKVEAATAQGLSVSVDHPDGGLKFTGLVNCSSIRVGTVQDCGDEVGPGQAVKVRISGFNKGLQLSMLEDPNLAPFENVTRQTWLPARVGHVQPTEMVVKVSPPDGSAMQDAVLEAPSVRRGFVQNLKNEFLAGQFVQVRVLGVDRSKQELLVTMLDAIHDVPAAAKTDAKAEQTALGIISDASKEGLLVMLPGGKQGFLPAREMGQELRKAVQSSQGMVGRRAEVRVRGTLDKHGRLQLSDPAKP